MKRRTTCRPDRRRTAAGNIRRHTDPGKFRRHSWHIAAQRALLLVGLPLFAAHCRVFPPPPPGFDAATFEQLAADPTFRAFALEEGEEIYWWRCDRCHGSSLQGKPGYPELRDDHWIWGRGPDAIADVVRGGVRLEGERDGEWHPGTRHGPGQTPPVTMPPYEDALSDEEIEAVSDFTARLIAAPADATGAADRASDALFAGRGADVYARACAACHGARGEGQPQLGFVRLAGGNMQLEARDADDVEEVVRDGMEARTMKEYGSRLSEAEIRCVAFWVAEVAAGRAAPPD